MSKLSSNAAVEAGSRYFFLGVHLTVLVPSSSTDGRLTVVEGVMSPGADGGPHLHEREDETIYVLEGELDVFVDGVLRRLGPGEASFAARGTPHRIVNATSKSVRALAIMTPGGFDEFLDCVAHRISPDGQTSADGPLQSPDAQLSAVFAAAERFGIRLLTP